MQAIISKYIPATNFKGSRIKAKCERGSITRCHREGERRCVMSAAVNYFDRITGAGGMFSGMAGLALTHTAVRFNVNQTALRLAILERRAAEEKKGTP